MYINVHTYTYTYIFRLTKTIDKALLCNIPPPLPPLVTLSLSLTHTLTHTHTYTHRDTHTQNFPLLHYSAFSPPPSLPPLTFSPPLQFPMSQLPASSCTNKPNRKFSCMPCVPCVEHVSCVVFSVFEVVQVTTHKFPAVWGASNSLTRFLCSNSSTRILCPMCPMCSVLQCVAACCSVQVLRLKVPCVPPASYVPCAEYVPYAVCCRVLQYVAVCKLSINTCHRICLICLYAFIVAPVSRLCVLTDTFSSYADIGASLPCNDTDPHKHTNTVSCKHI